MNNSSPLAWCSYSYIYSVLFGQISFSSISDDNFHPSWKPVCVADSLMDFYQCRYTASNLRMQTDFQLLFLAAGNKSQMSICVGRLTFRSKQQKRESYLCNSIVPMVHYSYRTWMYYIGGFRGGAEGAAPLPFFFVFLKCFTILL